MSTMNTDDLIAALSRDARQTGPAVHRRIAIALAVAAVTAFALLMASLGVRPDLTAASRTMLFDLKMLLVAVVPSPVHRLNRAVDGAVCGHDDNASHWRFGQNVTHQGHAIAVRQDQIQ